MRLLMIWSDPSWEQPIVGLVRQVVVTETTGTVYRADRRYLARDKMVEVTHTDGQVEKLRLWPTQTIEVIEDDGRPYPSSDERVRSREQDERALDEWYGAVEV